MNINADKLQENKSRSVVNNVAQQQGGGKSSFQFVDNRPQAIAQRKLQEAINNSSRVQQLKDKQNMVDNGHPVKQLKAYQARVQPTLQMKDTLQGKFEISPSFFGNTTTIQRYASSADDRFNVSENQHFAISKEAYPSAIYTDGQAPMALIGGLVWKAEGTIDINDKKFTKYEADTSAYDKKEGPGSEQFCGKFARELTGITQNTEQSTSEPGGVLYDNKTSPDRETGWANHYAAVVIKDAGDHGTFETAVGIEHVWAGIYGVKKGTTFKYKTQEANIDRLATIPDAIFPAEYKMEKSFWDNIFGRSGNKVLKKDEVRMPMGITLEQANLWKSEMAAWRDTGQEPTSEYMQKVIIKLKEELASLAPPE